MNTELQKQFHKNTTKYFDYVILEAPFILIVLRVVQSILMNYWTIRIGQIFVGYNYIVFPLLRQRQYSLTNDQGGSHDQIWSNVGNSLAQIRSG